MALWDGRFEKEMDQLVKEFNASIGFDLRMFAEDIRGSIAHVGMLAACGLVTEEERDQIVAGLEKIGREIEAGELEFSVEDEDIHMAIESRLIREIGEVGKKLHTARSRNDQCQLDARLYLKEEIFTIAVQLMELEGTLLEKAERYAEDTAPGYTHLQHAQPITIGFYFMAYFQMFRRDVDRLLDCLLRLDQSPLGACALAGTTLPIDRHLTAEALGFSAPTENAMDSVSDRDYALEFLSCAAISMMHISRMAEEMAWWNSSEFSFVEIDDSYCTGSSIMPQKKNPDMAELLRGKVGRVYGDLIQLLTVMKATPLAYNKDFQEDKEGLFDAVDSWQMSLGVLTGMLKHTEFRTEEIRSRMDEGFLNATDAAEHLALAGIPFREAHNLVGRMVKACEVKTAEGLARPDGEEAPWRLEDLSDEDLAAIDERLSRETLGDISVEACVAARKSFGGTAPEEVRRQIDSGREWLEAILGKEE